MALITLECLTEGAHGLACLCLYECCCPHLRLLLAHTRADQAHGLLGFPSGEVPAGMQLEQADGTAWMGMYCLNMLEISLELALHNKAYVPYLELVCGDHRVQLLPAPLYHEFTLSYEDVAGKFMEHFISIAHSMSKGKMGLWDPETKFFYDALRSEGACARHPHYLKVCLRPQNDTDLVVVLVVVMEVP